MPIVLGRIGHRERVHRGGARPVGRLDPGLYARKVGGENSSRTAVNFLSGPDAIQSHRSAKRLCVGRRACRLG